MKFSKNQAALQELWEGITEAYYNCPQSTQLDEICPYDSVLELYELLVIGLIPEISSVLFDSGYEAELPPNVRYVIKRYKEERIKLLKRIIKESQKIDEADLDD